MLHYKALYKFTSFFDCEAWHDLRSASSPLLIICLINHRQSSSSSCLGSCLEWFHVCIIIICLLLSPQDVSLPVLLSIWLHSSAHFQETPEGLSVPHLMCWQTERTFTTTRHCYNVFVILAPDIKLQTYLLTYLLLLLLLFPLLLLLRLLLLLLPLPRLLLLLLVWLLLLCLVNVENDACV